MPDPTKPNGKASKELEKQIQVQMAGLVERARDTKPKKVYADDPEFAETWPALWHWLNATQIGEKFGKDPSRLTLEIDNGTWKATLADNALRCSLPAVGVTYREAVGRLNDLLLTQDPPWQHWKRKKPALREIKEEEEK